MSNQILFFFSVLGAFNGLLLSVYFTLNANKKKFSNYFLPLLILMLCIRIFKSVFFYFNPQLANIFIQIGLSACILIGPFLFLYLKSHNNSIKSNWALHTIPYLICITILGIFYPYTENPEIWSRWIVKSIYFQWLFYIVLSFKYLLPIITKFKRKETLKNIDVWVLSIYLGVFFIWLAYYIGAFTSYIVGALSFSFIFHLIVLLFIFKNNKKSTFFQEQEKYKNKEMEQKTQQQIEQSFSIIVEKELFLNPNLTLADTAKQLNVSKHTLSQYINEKLGKSFSILINEYRVEKAKKLLQTPSAYSIESLGYDSGFNSKSTFFTSFKKATGLTPAEFQKKHLK